jgi:hypothetical protein
VSETELLAEARVAMESNYAGERRWAGEVVRLLTIRRSPVGKQIRSATILHPYYAKIPMIKALRECTGLGLSEAKGIVEHTNPLTLKTNSWVDSNRLREIVRYLVEQGCIVSSTEEYPILPNRSQGSLEALKHLLEMIELSKQLLHERDKGCTEETCRCDLGAILEEARQALKEEA